MRRLVIAVAAAIAFGLAGTPPAGAVPANGVVIDRAANSLDVTESVHCRPYRHWHRWGWGRGCRGWHGGGWGWRHRHHYRHHHHYRGHRWHHHHHHWRGHRHGHRHWHGHRGHRRH